MAKGEVVVCNLQSGPDLRVWEAIGPHSMALLMIADRREGVYKGTVNDDNTATRAFLRSEYETMTAEYSA